jgi:hypothetical protein
VRDSKRKRICVLHLLWKGVLMGYEEESLESAHREIVANGVLQCLNSIVVGRRYESKTIWGWETNLVALSTYENGSRLEQLSNYDYHPMNRTPSSSDKFELMIQVNVYMINPETSHSSPISDLIIKMFVRSLFLSYHNRRNWRWSSAARLFWRELYLQTIINLRVKWKF